MAEIEVGLARGEAVGRAMDFERMQQLKGGSHKESHNKLVGMLSQLLQSIGDTGSAAQEKAGEAGIAAGGGSNTHKTRGGE